MERGVNEILCLRAEELVKGGADGISAARALSDIVDAVSVSAYESAIKDHRAPSVERRASTDKDNNTLDARRLALGAPRGLALVAIGGYGRREIAPYSDIDLMLLSKNRGSANTGAAEAVLYKLWDTGMRISHCFRTLPECIEDSFSDLKTRTSLIESRFLAGDKAVSDEFKRDVYQKVLFKNRKEFVRELLQDIDGRHKSYGDSVYLLEPNVKEGRGGLRDVHSAAWLARVALKLGDLKESHTFLPQYCSWPKIESLGSVSSGHPV